MGPYSFILQSVEHFLYARHHSNAEGTRVNKTDHILVFTELHSAEEDMNKITFLIGM